MIDRGRLVAARISARKTWIRRSDIDALFEAEEPLVDLRPLITELPIKIKDCYTIGEIQERFGVSDSSLYNIIKKGNIPKLVKGWNTYVLKKEIEKILIPKDKKDESNH